jgi:hypothetical protein
MHRSTGPARTALTGTLEINCRALVIVGSAAKPGEIRVDGKNAGFGQQTDDAMEWEGVHLDQTKVPRPATVEIDRYAVPDLAICDSRFTAATLPHIPAGSV